MSRGGCRGGIGLRYVKKKRGKICSDPMSRLPVPHSVLRTPCHLGMPLRDNAPSTVRTTQSPILVAIYGGMDESCMAGPNGGGEGSHDQNINQFGNI